MAKSEYGDAQWIFQQSQFYECFQLLGRLQSRIAAKNVCRDDVVKLRSMLEAMSLIEDVIHEQSPGNQADLQVLAVLRTEWPILFYAFCTLLGVDAGLIEEEDTRGESGTDQCDFQSEDIWNRLAGASMLQKRTGDRLVTAQMIASHIGIERRSLGSKTKAWPKPAKTGRGNIPSEYRWEELCPVLRRQYTKDDWDSF